MRHLVQSITVLTLVVMLVGCGRTETQNPLSPQVAQLVRINRELQRQVESQGKVISAMGGALILTGGGLAIVLAILWMRGKK